MKTLIVYYSQSGNTRKVAEKIRKALSCDMDEIQYDKAAHTVGGKLNPADYDRVILMCPIWGFHLSEPMKLYLRQRKANIKRYRLAVTCGSMGLRGCVADCKKILEKSPEVAVKIKAKTIADNSFSISEITAK